MCVYIQMDTVLSHGAIPSLWLRKVQTIALTPEEHTLQWEHAHTLTRYRMHHSTYHWTQPQLLAKVMWRRMVNIDSSQVLLLSRCSLALWGDFMPPLALA